ncbi:nuclease-related domain-containing protein [Neobacillus sp. LXY-4]|uniref:nuclease-related domain-containing protein n=1 Tax=Neobacillus sp. LXY-4 TaxID=3379826 RepID=UPI003EDFDB99
MPLKSRTESKELKVLTLLNKRMDLEASVKQHYRNLRKGYEGEVQFDSLTASLDSKFYILNDLLLEVNNTLFQIDSLFITQDSLIVFEIKNFEGDYIYQDGNFKILTSKKDITNPLHQLNRCKTLLRQLLQKHGFHFPIDGHVVFINSNFFLYQAPLNEPILFNPQLNGFLKNLSAKPSKLNNMHRKLADLLLKEHITDPPFTLVPPYEYGHFKKGVTSACCDSFLVTADGRKMVCDVCGHVEGIESAVVRGVEEIMLLFPDTRVTANIVYDWCRLAGCERKIRRVLARNYKIVGKNRYSYYVKK